MFCRMHLFNSEMANSVSLQLYLDILKAGVNNLEKTRKATKLLKQEKMEKLEAALWVITGLKTSYNFSQEE
jgi:hypothetical protein